MTRLTDLSPAQIELLVKLDDLSDQSDLGGFEIGSLSVADLIIVRSLVSAGLAMAIFGRHGEQSVRLIDKGRGVRRTGEG